MEAVQHFGAPVTSNIDRTMALEMVRVTEAAARAAVRYLGQGDKNAVDGAAVDAMRRALNAMEIHATVAIGEGEKDDAPMLFDGEVVGTGNGPRLDIAVDPVDGTTLASKGIENAISVIAIAEEGNFLKASDAWYMEKLAFGADLDPSAFNLNMSTAEIIKQAASQKGVPVSEIVVCLLDRPRHQQLVDDIRSAGARMKLISDGDVAGAIASAMPGSGVDLLMGQGGFPEGVIAAAALKCLGGHILGRLVFNDDAAKEQGKSEGFDPDKIYSTEDMAAGEVVFAATGVTNGTMLQGISRVEGGEMSHSVVMRSRTGTVRWVETFHRM